MKKLSNKKILSIAYAAFLFACLLLFIWTFFYLKKNVYETIYTDSEYIKAQSKFSKEELNIKDFEEIFKKLEKRSEKTIIFGINDIFN